MIFYAQCTIAKFITVELDYAPVALFVFASDKQIAYRLSENYGSTLVTN